MYMLPGMQRAALKQAEKTENRNESHPGTHRCVQLVCLTLLLTGPVAQQQSHSPVVKIW